MTHYTKHEEPTKAKSTNTKTDAPDGTEAAGDAKEQGATGAARAQSTDTAATGKQSVTKLFTLIRLGNPEVSSTGGVGTPGHVCGRYESRQALLDAIPSWQGKHPSAQLYVQENDVESVDSFRGDAS